jgi:hypothetical protein
MYYGPRHFKPQEIFTKETVKQFSNDGSWGRDAVIDPAIWRLMDARVTWTMDSLRDHFGSMISNDYLWGGKNQFRGYRPIHEILHKSDFCKKNSMKAKVGSLTSQHCFGRANDSKFKNASAEEVREDIRKNPRANRYKYITFIEDDVSWLHFDVRHWNARQSGIFFWSPNKS